MGSQTAARLAPLMWFPPSNSECRFAIRPHPSRPNLIIDFLYLSTSDAAKSSSGSSRKFPRFRQTNGLRPHPILREEPRRQANLQASSHRGHGGGRPGFGFASMLCMEKPRSLGAAFAEIRLVANPRAENSEISPLKRP